jgi:hypothetical protein
MAMRLLATLLATGLCLVIPIHSASGDQLSDLMDQARAALGPGFGHVRGIHGTGTIRAGGMNGTVEWWVDLTSGAYEQTIDAGPLTGAFGYHGQTGWLQDAKGIVLRQDAPAAKASAANAAFYWRNGWLASNYDGASVSFLGQREEQGRTYALISITPVGGYTKSGGSTRPAAN